MPVLLAETGTPTWSVLVDNAFTLTLLFIFVTAVIVAIIRQRWRDKCLNLLHDFHVTFADAEGQAIWGDLMVAHSGVELLFDAAYETEDGLTKTSALVYEDTLGAGLALCRAVDSLTDDERRRRERQIRRSFRPTPVRRFIRGMLNTANSLRDALGKAFNLVLGHLASKNPRVKQLVTQKGEVDKLRATLDETVARAYEPLLERQIGKPVVLRVRPPMAPDEVIELPGYLVDYTNTYLAVFNVVHEPFEDHHLTLEGVGEREVEGEAESEGDTDAPSGDHQGPGFTVQRRGPQIQIHCTGQEVVVVKTIETPSETFDLDCALLRGSYAELSIGREGPVQLHLRLTRRVDIVCPRAHAVITHGGRYQGPDPRRSKLRAPIRARGAAPVEHR